MIAQMIGCNARAARADCDSKAIGNACVKYPPGMYCPFTRLSGGWNDGPIQIPESSAPSTSTA
jgi:hypothetical protein